MKNKDILLIILAFLGWSWGIVQFIVNRQSQKKDKIADRKYTAYSSYMKKSDELMNNVRTDPNMIYGISNDLMKTLLSGNEDQINDALILFNKNLIDFTKKATEPLLILRQELNSLLIICSNQLASKIEEMNLLTTDFNNAMQQSLGTISSYDSETVIKSLKTLGNDERWQRFERLNREIIELMRKEIGTK